jgi:hypothetical protein
MVVQTRYVFGHPSEKHSVRSLCEQRSKCSSRWTYVDLFEADHASAAFRREIGTNAVTSALHYISGLAYLLYTGWLGSRDALEAVRKT